jgi:hypothetical protein
MSFAMFSRLIIFFSALAALARCGAFAQAAALPSGTKVTPPVRINLEQASDRVAAAGPVFVFTCRAGPSTDVQFGILDEAARSRTTDSLYWSVRGNFRVAPFTTAARILQPGECKLPRADFVDAPIVNLWRYLDTGGSRYTPPNGLQSLWVAPERGVLTVNSIDTVFQDFIFRLSDSRQYDGSVLRGTEPGQSFEVRVTRMPCARNCVGFTPPTWEFYVVAAPVP